VLSLTTLPRAFALSGVVSRHPFGGLRRLAGGPAPGALDLGVENLFELLGQAGLHAGPRLSVRVAIAALLTRCLRGWQVVFVISHVSVVHSFMPATCYDPAAMELYGVRIPTIITDNIAVRCSGCGEVIKGRPWRISILDIVAPEAPVSWTQSAAINPGPFEFHADPSHVLDWIARRGMLFCRRSQVRQIMRPVWVSTDPRRLGLCDGIHRDNHEFVDPAAHVADRS